LFGEKLIAIDGTKIKADNSKKNNYSEKKIKRQLKYIEEKTTQYLEMLDNADDQEAPEPKYTVDEIKKKLENLKEHKQKYEDMQKTLKETEATEISTVDPDAYLAPSYGQ